MIKSLLWIGARLCLLNVCIQFSAQAHSQPPTGTDQTKAVDEQAQLRESIKQAGALLKEGKLIESAEMISAASKSIEDIVAAAAPNQLTELKKVHTQLEKAHEILNVQGAELARLPTWDALSKARKQNATPANTAAPLASTKSPIRQETVSFARDIAPILISKCNGCHYAGNRASGGLQFNTYSQLLKGGDSGPALETNNPDMSYLLRRLKGQEEPRMPMGRPPLPEKQIELIATWIKEGASFDGANKESRLDQIVGQAFVSKATHAELMAKRIESGREKWKIASPKNEASEAIDDQFHIIGNIGEENAKALLTQANTAAQHVRKNLKLTGKEPIIKGGVTVFALKQRYDYSEFGKMVESRELPSEWSSHWRSETLDSYIAIVFDKNEDKINVTSLAQQLTSLWVGSHEGVPRWFADGAGRQSLAIAVGAGDARVQPWLKRLPDSMSQLKNLKPLLEGTMNDEAAATIGFGVIRFMFENKMKVQYEAILRSLAGGMTFEQATKKTIGSVESFLQQLLGKKL